MIFDTSNYYFDDIFPTILAQTLPSPSLLSSRAAQPPSLGSFNRLR